MTQTTIKFTVRAERDGRFWLLTFPDLGGNHASQALNLDEIEAVARDYISLTLDLDFVDVVIGKIVVELNR